MGIRKGIWAKFLVAVSRVRTRSEGMLGSGLSLEWLQDSGRGFWKDAVLETSSTGGGCSPAVPVQMRQPWFTRPRSLHGRVPVLPACLTKWH